MSQNDSLNIVGEKLDDPKVLLLKYKEKFDVELEKYLKRKTEEFSKVSEFAGKFTSDLAEFTLRGGKRFRPALIYYSYKLFGGNNETEILKLSMFIELIQSFLLIHDDIMDRALLRRGGTTIHKIYEKYSSDENFEDDIHFGMTMGILSGDLANQLALEIISESDFPLDRKNKLLNIVATEISKVCFGQIHDILLNYDFPKGYQEADILKVHLYKTATYTYRLPLFAGAVLAGATDEELKILDEYAVPSGIAFQIRDDVLGVFGDSDETGKENKGDIMEGKKTLLVTEAYRKGSLEDKDTLSKLLGKKDLTDSEADEVRSIFQKVGALEYSKAECQKQVDKARSALQFFADKDKDAFEFLDCVANYMIIRNV